MRNNTPLFRKLLEKSVGCKLNYSADSMLVVLAACLLSGLPQPSQAAPAEDPIEVVRETIRADRQAVVTEIMQFTPNEADAFWPIYRQYRADMDALGDRLKSLILEYAGLYPDVPDDHARRILKDWNQVQKKQVSTRQWYLKRFARVLPATKILRFAQVESRLDLALRVELAAHIPLVPISGHIAGKVEERAAFVKGTAGGVFVKEVKVQAVVAAIDPVNRKVTLVSPEGIKQVVKAGPEVINFNQIQVGDQLRVTATEALVVEMAREDEGTGTAELVALAPEGSKPAGLVAETTQTVGVITAIDIDNRTATLRFEDGSLKTFPVRPDLDLAKYQVGQPVAFRYVGMIALKVERP